MVERIIMKYSFTLGDVTLFAHNGQALQKAFSILKGTENPDETLENLNRLSKLDNGVFYVNDSFDTVFTCFDEFDEYVRDMDDVENWGVFKSRMSEDGVTVLSYEPVIFEEVKLYKTVTYEFTRTIHREVTIAIPMDADEDDYTGRAEEEVDDWEYDYWADGCDVDYSVDEEDIECGDVSVTIFE